MDNIEITVFDEIKDYKEKINFFNFRQWIFAILIIIAVVPTYLILKEKIGEEAFSVAILVTGSIGADVAAKAEVAVPMADTINASASAKLKIVFFFMVCYAPF